MVGVLSILLAWVAPAHAECFPECRTGYFCHEDECISRCNPECDDGYQCTDEGECERELPVPAEAPPAPAPVDPDAIPEAPSNAPPAHMRPKTDPAPEPSPSPPSGEDVEPSPAPEETKKGGRVEPPTVEWPTMSVKVRSEIGLDGSAGANALQRALEKRETELGKCPTAPGDSFSFDVVLRGSGAVKKAEASDGVTTRASSCVRGLILTSTTTPQEYPMKLSVTIERVDE